MAGSKYLLIEYPSIGKLNYTVDIIHQPLSEININIIADLERNRDIADKTSILTKPIKHGAVSK